MTDNAPRVGKTGEHIIALEPGIGTKQIINGVTRRQHAEYVLDGQSPAPDDRLAAKNSRVDRDSLEKVDFVHREGCPADLEQDITPFAACITASP